MIKIDLVGGARPNFIKLGPIYQEMIKRENFMPRFVHTGQHISEVMASDNWASVGLQKPDLYLGTNSFKGDLGYIPIMMENYDNAIKKDMPDIVLTAGDTDSTLVGTFVAKRNDVPVVHVEAGLKGHSDEFEEYNRRMIDSIADLLLAPTMDAVNRLRRRGYNNVRFVGNVMADALKQITKSKKWKFMDAPRPDILITFHRPYNVDNYECIMQLIHELDFLAAMFNVYFSVHPRTAKRMEEFHISKRPYFYRSLPYDKFTKILSQSKVVITDSGGLQNEAAFFKIPCIAAMQITAWPDLVTAGVVTLCPDFNFSSIILDLMDNFEPKYSIIGLEGHAAMYICDEIERWHAEL